MVEFPLEISELKHFVESMQRQPIGALIQLHWGASDDFVWELGGKHCSWDV